MFLRKGRLSTLPIPHTQRKALNCMVVVIGRAEERVAKLVDSPDQPESEASYKLVEGGWDDV